MGYGSRPFQVGHRIVGAWLKSASAATAVSTVVFGTTKRPHKAGVLLALLDVHFDWLTEETLPPSLLKKLKKFTPMSDSIIELMVTEVLWPTLRVRVFTTVLV